MVGKGKMRPLFLLLGCLMLVVTTWSGAAQAAGPGCSEMAGQMAVHVAGDCDEVPADADKNDPHCHTGCHGHQIAAPVPARAPGQAFAVTRVYAVTTEATLTAHQVDQALRPPQA